MKQYLLINTTLIIVAFSFWVVVIKCNSFKWPFLTIDIILLNEIKKIKL